MPKDNVHYGGWEHRDVHNINGMLFVSVGAAVEALWLIFFSDQPNFPSRCPTHQSSNTPLRPYSLVLRRLAALWRNVDR